MAKVLLWIKPGHVVHKQKKWVPWTLFPGGLCAGNAWNPAPHGQSRLWERPPPRSSFHSWTPKEILCPFSLDHVSEQGSYKHLSSADVLFTGLPHSLATEIQLQACHSPCWGKGFMSTDTCCNMVIHHRASPGCGHSSPDFQPKFFWMECSNCCVKITAAWFGAVTATPEPWTDQSIKWGTHYQCPSTKIGLK